jgi:membrane-bound lytic murein transglycosylase B
MFRRLRMKQILGGAMGQPQFLPSSYLDHAVDFDGDGKRDIWNSTADSLASIANYLAKSGWVRGRDWGFEAVIPEGVTCALEGPDRARPIRDLTAWASSAFPAGRFPSMSAGRRAWCWCQPVSTARNSSSRRISM